MGLSQAIERDLGDMERKLGCYIDKGRLANSHEFEEETAIAVRLDGANAKPLQKMSGCKVRFLAVDCSTRTLKRANNWGVYVLRATYAGVEGRDVQWGYEEQLCTEVGDARTRRNALARRRIELESRTALKALYEEHTQTSTSNVLRKLDEGDYVLLDGASFFGGERGFAVSLHDESMKRNINLLCISKQSSSLVDEKGRDLIAAACAVCSSLPTWVYHPVQKADTDKHLYGDVSLIKLSEDSPRAFRCDVMAYLTSRDVAALIAPLTSISGDPRCVGYPIPLWLAHDFSAPSDAVLLQYLDEVHTRLKGAGILERLRSEELSCSFADELHGVRYPFKWEMIGGYV